MDSLSCSCECAVFCIEFEDWLTSSHRVGYLISAIFICLEYLRLGMAYRRLHIILFVSFWIKLGFIVVEVALSIAFGVLMKHSHRKNVAAVLEWGKLRASISWSGHANRV